MSSKKEIYTNEIKNCISNIIFYQREIEMMKEKIGKLKEVLEYQDPKQLDSEN